MSEYKIQLEWTKKDGQPYHRMATLNSKEDGIPEITAVTPPEFGNGIPNHWSPEHLFVASSVSCFFTTLLKISDDSNLKIKDLKISATGLLEETDAGSIISKIDLYPVLTLESEKFEKKTKRILEKAEENCLVSKSIRSSVILHPEINW